MENQFETTLSSPEGEIDGIVHQNGGAWEFRSIDGGIQLVIAKNEDGNWQRMTGSEPYLTSWVGELGDRVKAYI